jgi:hypothetical protein
VTLIGTPAKIAASIAAILLWCLGFL